MADEVESDERPEGDREPGVGEDGMPRWVKGFAVAAAILVVLVVMLMLTGHHGPSRHGG